MTEDRINNPEVGLVEVTQSQHREKKRQKKINRNPSTYGITI